MRFKTKYRVVKSPNFWTDEKHYYPEEKYWFWPFWFRMGHEYQIFFKTEEEANDFISKIP